MGEKKEKVEKMEEGLKTIKVSRLNHSRISHLQAKLWLARKKRPTQNDVITYLFENQHKEKGNK